MKEPMVGDYKMQEDEIDYLYEDDADYSDVYKNRVNDDKLEVDDYDYIDTEQ